MLNSNNSFKLASLLIKLIAVLIGCMLIMMSKYALIFFVSAMLPTICIIFFDSGRHRCLSATICSFNLMSVMPCLVRIWSSSSTEYEAKEVIADISTWITVYGTTLIGQIIYILVPLLISKLHVARVKIKIKAYKRERQLLVNQWGIDLVDEPEHPFDEKLEIKKNEVEEAEKIAKVEKV